MGSKSIQSRLSRVVQAMNKTAAESPVCGGAERSVLRVRFADETRAVVPSCPQCKREPAVTELIIEDQE